MNGCRSIHLVATAMSPEPSPKEAETRLGSKHDFTPYR